MESVVEKIQREKAERAEQQAERDEHMAMVRRTLELLHPGTDACFEVRCLDVPGRGKPHSASGYFRDHATAAKAIVAFDETRKPGGIYVTINPPDPRLYDRCPDKITDFAEPTTSDRDILRRRTLVVDCDPQRPPKIMASEAERDVARQLAADCEDFLTSCGWPLPLIGDSGNGAYLIYRIDEPNDTASEKLIRDVLRGLSYKVLSPTVDLSKPDAIVDLSMFNASRIARVFGTTNRKGGNVALHRRSALFDPPDEWVTVSRELLEAVAALAPEPATNGHHSSNGHASHNGNGHAAGGDAKSRLLVDRWLTDCGYNFQTKESNGWTLYLLDRCPFDESHGGHKEVHVGQHVAGALSASCKHSSCQTRGWTEFKEAIGRRDPQKHFDPPLPPRSKPGKSKGASTNGSTNGAAFNFDPNAPADQQAEAPPEFKIERLTSAELDAGDFTQRYLIEGILPAGQVGTVGGKFKTLKTSIAADMAISVGSATPFLGRFLVAEQRPVIVLSCESGMAAIQSMARRICAAKDIRLADLEHVHWSAQLVQLSSEIHRGALVDFIGETQAELVILDPSYLLAGPEVAEQSTNLYAMGEFFAGLSAVCQETGATLALVHHFKKTAGGDREKFAQPELEDLALAGIAEWVRWWVLLSRRAEFDAEAGQHRLWASVGGSAGHHGAYGIDVSEGRQADPGGRRWQVEVFNAAEVREARQAGKEQRQAEAAKKKLDEDRQKIVNAIFKFPDGETKNAIRERTPLSPNRFGVVWATLIEDETVIPAIGIKKNNRTLEAYKLRPDSDD